MSENRILQQPPALSPTYLEASLRYLAIGSLLASLGCALYAVVSLGINNLFAWILFGTWILIPYAVGRSFVLRRDANACRRIVKCVSVVLASAAGAYAIWDVTVGHPDAQGAIAVLFVPLIQFSVAAACALIGIVVCKFQLWRHCS